MIGIQGRLPCENEFSINGHDQVDDEDDDDDDVDDDDIPIKMTSPRKIDKATVILMNCLFCFAKVLHSLSALKFHQSMWR